MDAGEIPQQLALLKTKQPDSIKRNYFDEDNDYRSAVKQNHRALIKAELFYFDPNTIPAGDWKKLGIRDRTISTIQRFIAKGGRFRQPEDIKKIWGLHEDEVERLLPFIKIPEQVSSPEPIKKEFVSIKYEPKRSFEHVDINLADTSALIRLPGIGSKLSNRIIAFRDKLGGFYNIEQVAETFGLADSVFQKIRPMLLLKQVSLKLVNINIASLDELKQHPYIRYTLAKLIVEYRTQHGNFNRKDDIKKIMTVTDELYKKLLPYLTIE